MKIALVQMQVVAGDVAGNRERGLVMAEEAAQNADMVVLPEIWTTGYSLRQVEALAEAEDGTTLTGIRDISRKYHKTIIAGSLPLKSDGKVYNCSVVIGPDGVKVADYRKIHLFSMMGEERFFAPGSERGVFTLGDLRAGLAICYELRFPELFRALTLEGAQVIFMPAEWPSARAEHWHTLVRARAIENQVYICAVNCVGEHRGNPFYGHSLIIGPTGEVVASGGDDAGIVYGEIDTAVVAKARETMQVWQDRCPEVYL